MKFELHENAREAFQFLSIGAGVVLVIRLAIWLIGLGVSTTDADPLVQAIAYYRNGYVLLDPHTLAVGGLAMIPRVAVAILFIVCTALIAAACGTLITTLIRHKAIKGAVQGARIGMLLSTGWVIYALLAAPPVSVHIGAQSLSILTRPSFLGVVPYPFGWNERVFNWSEMEFIQQGSGTDATERDRVQVVVVNTGSEWIRIAQLMDGYSHSDTVSLDADSEAQRLIDQLTILSSSTAR